MTDETPPRATPKGPIPKDRADALFDQDQKPDAMLVPDVDGEPAPLDNRSGMGIGKPKT